MCDRRAALLIALALIGTACSAAVQSSGDPTTPTTVATTVAVTTTPTPTTTVSSAPTSTVPTTTTEATGTTTSTSTSTTTTTTTSLPPLDVYDVACALEVVPRETIDDIVAMIDDDTVDAETIMAENDMDSPELEAGQLLDVCVDNGINDIDGSTRTERNAVFVEREVMAQQAKLNELFEGYGIRELLIDGISGPVTRQRLCAFRLSAGLPVSTEDMKAGSEEEALLMATEALGTPFTSAILAERWVLIDETCQIMFVGLGTERLQFVFPTSTGLADFPTRPQVRSEVFKYDPALENGGWHDSFDFPAAEDNPLNGNMYKPLYFDGGQAIHGANNVPRSPASHGCARLRLDDMNALVNWLGLGDANGVTYNEDRINLTVNVQGRYVDR
jgi:lipoprotein-anchoring transpeptidase ErfK/SrfK